MRQFFPLAFEQTVDYFTNELAHSAEFGILLLKNTEFAKGNFYTLLPNKSHQEKLYLFEEGEIIPPAPVQLVFIETLGTVPAVSIDDGNQSLSELLYNKMTQDSTLVCLVEDCERIGLSDIDLCSLYGVTYHDSLYYLLRSERVSREHLYLCIREGHTAYHFLCVLSRYPFDHQLGAEMPENLLLAISRNVKIIVVGAYDGEGYVIWELAENDRSF